VIDEISSKTLMGCGFKLPRERLVQNRGQEHSFPCSGSYAGSSFIASSQLKAELSEVKKALAEEKAHEDLLAVFFTLTATLSPPP